MKVQSARENKQIRREKEEKERRRRKQQKGSHTITGLVEAVRRVAVAREDDHFVPTFLQSDGRIHYQSLGASYSQVGMQKDDCLSPLLVAGHLRTEARVSCAAACSVDDAVADVVKSQVVASPGRQCSITTGMSNGSHRASVL